MTNFNIITTGCFLCTEAFTVAINSYKFFLDSVTSKHLKNIKLHVVEEKNKNKEVLNLIDEKGMKDHVNVINRSDHEALQHAYNNACLFFFPSHIPNIGFVTEAMDSGMAVLTFDLKAYQPVLTPAFSMLINHRLPTENVRNFSNYLRILYFDPAARNIMKKRAKEAKEARFSTQGRSRMQ